MELFDFIENACTGLEASHNLKKSSETGVTRLIVHLNNFQIFPTFAVCKEA